jgi:steroid 5-alpha reductase family enzyme
MKTNLVSLAGITTSLAVALGIAYAGSQGGMQIAGMPLLFLCGVVAFAVQWIFFIPAFIFQTEKYFDLTGSLTFISLALLVMYLNGAASSVHLLIGCMVVIWAVRLGAFLFRRISSAGHDRRFRTIKPDFLQFLMTWTIQGLWVFITFSAGLAAMTSGKTQPLTTLAGIGAFLWVAGFAIEVIADRQKQAFNNDPENADRFITTGLWAGSRHPNYFGEIVLWCGIALMAFPSLSGWQYVTLVSPVFVFVLLNYISGVRMLEARANRKWADDVEYQNYSRRTPSLIIRPWLMWASS